MAEDIICTVPEPCGDNECRYRYHLAYYWMYDDGTYTVCDCDGDHTPCEETDVPTAEEELRRWRDYFVYVARTGLDPVHEFVRPDTGKNPRVWQARVRGRDGALLVTGFRRRSRGPWIAPRDVPAGVREYFGLDDGDHLPDFRSLDQLAREATDCEITDRTAGGLNLAATVEEASTPWLERRVRSWLRKKARQAVREKDEQLGAFGRSAARTVGSP